MLIGKICYHSALWCPDHKTVLDKIRLVDIFDRSGILPDGSCQCIQSHRSSLKLFNNCHQDIPVILIKTKLVDFQKI